MDSEKLLEPQLITRSGELHQMIKQLEQEPIIAVDTESNSLFAYYEQVCLIQFSTTETDYLVDPLVLGDLSALGELFANPHIEKVFHAAEYDIICLKRDFGFTFDNLFDTMVAASILGIEQVGLGNMLESEFNVQIDKRYQRANWGQRPLPKHLLSYARFDTHYLIALRHRLHAALKESGRWPLAEEDFKRLANYSNGLIENGQRASAKSVEEVCWRITGAHDLHPQQAAVLQELCRYRDEVARSINRPLFKVINDATLLAIASSLPENAEQLKRLPGMSEGQIQRHGGPLLRLVQRGLQAPPIQPPRNRRPDEQYIIRLENLRQWRKETGRHMGVKSDVILPRDLLMAIAEKDPRDLKQLSEILAELPWRLEKYGEEILGVLNHYS